MPSPAGLYPQLTVVSVSLHVHGSKLTVKYRKEEFVSYFHVSWKNTVPSF